MAQIKILPEKSSIFNLQKFCISEQLLPPSSHGKFVSITMSCVLNGSNKNHINLFCLCQIFLSKTMHPSFCKLNMSVCGYLESSDKNIYPESSIENLNCVSMNNLNILNSISNIKSVSVTVVLDKPTDVYKWRNQTVKMGERVKNVLKLFTLKCGSVVFLDCVRTLYDSDIYCLVLENLGKFNVGRVVNSTKVKVSKIISKITFEQIYSASRVLLPTLGGLEKPMRTLTNIVKIAASEKATGISYPVYKQVLILGPTGCGKTALVQTVTRDCGMVLRTLVGPELSSPLPGEAEKALTTLFDECKLLAQECPGGCVLLLDQVESVCKRRESSSEGHLMRIANQLFMLLETVNNTVGLVVVGTSSRPQALDPAVRRPGHFDHEIHIGMSNEAERASILHAVTRQYCLSDLVCEDVACWTPGFVGADLALLATNVSRHLVKLGKSECNKKEELLAHWKVCVGQQQPTALKGQLGVIRCDAATLSNLGGVEQVKRSLLQAIQWPLTHPEAFHRLGLPQPKGVLLYGPPGCAKTSLVRSIASATNTTFLAVSAAQVYSPYVGDAERTISELFHRARIGAPAILFIDEIDALVGSRGCREKGTQERILSAFLTEMDGVGLRLDSGTSQVGVVVVAATNRPDMLDPALTRPGRFDRLIYVGPPDTNQRLDILNTVSQKIPLAADVNLPLISENTAFYSGADLSQLCKEAGLCAMSQEGMDVQEVSQKHWLQALQAMKPSLSAEQVERYQQMSAASNLPR